MTVGEDIAREFWRLDGPCAGDEPALERWLVERINTAVVDEREGCAKVAERYAEVMLGDGMQVTLRTLAKTIRARGDRGAQTITGSGRLAESINGAAELLAEDRRERNITIGPVSPAEVCGDRCDDGDYHWICNKPKGHAGQHVHKGPGCAAGWD